MSHEVIKFGGLMERLGAAPEDSIDISYRPGGIGEIVIKKSSGEVFTRKYYLPEGNFQIESRYDPSTLSRDDKIKLVHRLRKEGMKQIPISKLTGICQSSVSNYLTIPNEDD